MLYGYKECHRHGNVIDIASRRCRQHFTNLNRRVPPRYAAGKLRQVCFLVQRHRAEHLPDEGGTPKLFRNER
jgi:hypothetical protein